MTSHPTSPAEPASEANNLVAEDGHAKPSEGIFDELAETTTLTTQMLFAIGEAVLGGSATVFENFFEQPRIPEEKLEQSPSTFASQCYAEEPHFIEPEF